MRLKDYGAYYEYFPHYHDDNRVKIRHYHHGQYQSEHIISWEDLEDLIEKWPHLIVKSDDIYFDENSHIGMGTSSPQFPIFRPKTINGRTVMVKIL